MDVDYDEDEVQDKRDSGIKGRRGEVDDDRYEGKCSFVVIFLISSFQQHQGENQS